MEKINIGLISFINSFPISYTLEKWALKKFVLNWGYPVLINNLIKEERVQVAQISAFEYLKNKNNYILIKEACITSDSECGSVILFSNYKIEDLEGKTIGLPYNSATSINMLKIILKEKKNSFKNIKFIPHKYEATLSENLQKNFDAVLYIGDNALISRYNLETSDYDNKIFQYDMGNLWKNITGLPPVFAVWVARADWATTHKDDFERLKFIINKAVEAGLGVYFNEIIKKAASTTDLPNCFIKDYLTAKIKYKFTAEHEKSLNLFKELYSKHIESFKAGCQ